MVDTDINLESFSAGPLVENQATKDFVFITKALLENAMVDKDKELLRREESKSKPVKAVVKELKQSIQSQLYNDINFSHVDGSYFVQVNGVNFNLTEILANMNANHVIFSDAYKEQYASLISQSIFDLGNGNRNTTFRMVPSTGTYKYLDQDHPFNQARVKVAKAETPEECRQYLNEYYEAAINTEKEMMASALATQPESSRQTESELLEELNSLNDLHFAEKNAINIYTGQGYMWLNNVMRGTAPEKMPGREAGMFLNFNLPGQNQDAFNYDMTEVLLHTAMGFSGLNQVPVRNGINTSRVEARMPRERLAEFIKAAESQTQDKDATIFSKGYISTTIADVDSLKLEADAVSDVVIEYQNAMGKYITPLSQRIAEKEVLLLPSHFLVANYRVENLEHGGKRYFFTLKAVDSPDLMHEQALKVGQDRRTLNEQKNDLGVQKPEEPETEIQRCARANNAAIEVLEQRLKVIELDIDKQVVEKVDGEKQAVSNYILGLDILIGDCKSHMKSRPSDFLNIEEIIKKSGYTFDLVTQQSIENAKYEVEKVRGKATPSEQSVSKRDDLKIQMLNDRALSVLMKGYSRVKEIEFREPLKEVYDRCKKQVENAPSVLLDIRKSAREIDFKPPEGSMAKSILDKAQQILESVSLKDRNKLR